MDHAHDHDDEHDDEHEHDLGLSHDLPTVLNRRRMLALLGGGAGAVALAACAPTSTGSGATASATASAGTTSQIPEETAGPYPGDGSNGPNVLTQSGIVRQDITRSFGGSSGVAAGVPLTIRLTILDTKNGAAPIEGAAVYLWHCDREGRYSLYSPGVTNENYLRGVQAADASGVVTFTSIFPACYSGRWPHIHFEVYQNLDQASSAGDKLRTSQVALPEDASKLVYATSGYDQSVSNLSRVSLSTDNVFRDGWSLEMGTVSGTVADGLTVSLTVPI